MHFKATSVLKDCFFSDLQDHKYVRIETICNPFTNNSFISIYHRNINMNYDKAFWNPEILYCNFE